MHLKEFLLELNKFFQIFFEINVKNKAKYFKLEYIKVKNQEFER